VVRYGALTMPAQVQAVGQYEPALGCSAVVDVLDVAVRVAAQEVRAKVGRTCGVWGEAKRLDHNFQRLALPGAIHLPEGPVDVVIAVEGPLPEKSFNVSSVELTPVSAKQTIAAVEAEGLTCRTSADWFVQAGYGLMFHGTEGRTSMDGATKPYEQAVNDFDVTRWRGDVYQSLVAPAETRYYQYGAAQGLLYHNLFALDCHWGQCKVVGGRTVELPIWPAEVFGPYIPRCLDYGGVTTVNLGIYPDGTMSPETARTMRVAGKIVRG